MTNTLAYILSFQASLIFEGKVRSLPIKCYNQVGPIKLSNIRLTWKKLTKTNTLAYILSFQASLIFEGKVRSLPIKCYIQVSLIKLSNIRLNRRNFLRTNTVAYFARPSVTKKNVFKRLNRWRELPSNRSSQKM
jgi:hypothetical protein